MQMVQSVIMRCGRVCQFLYFIRNTPQKGFSTSYPQPTKRCLCTSWKGHSDKFLFPSKTEMTAECLVAMSVDGLILLLHVIQQDQIIVAVELIQVDLQGADKIGELLGIAYRRTDGNEQILVFVD